MIYKEKPSDFNKKADVVACYVQHNGKFILLQRQPHKSSPNQWGLPAGKVDAGETIQQVMIREIFEETGLQLKEGMLEYFDSLYVRNVSNDIYYHMFAANLEELPEIKINPLEHTGFGWFSPQESLKMDLVHDLGECTKLFYKLSG